MFDGTSKSDLDAWWHDATVYQIFPRSFCDTNGDGIGDLPGVISKLDYLQDLGIDLIWLSPVYRSPMADMGYDIADYRAIADEYGTIADVDRLVEQARRRGIGILLDLAVNHTSDRHAWFETARRDRDNDRRDYYIWRDPAPDGGPPNALQSCFGGPAWTLDPATGQYYLHLFAPEQPDLNWSNTAVRSEIHAIMNWWLDRGIAGFRLDVIDLIGKDPDRGVTDNGPALHFYLHEMHERTLAGRRTVTVGEAWGATPDHALLFSGRDRRELSMVFQFEHVTGRWNATHGKWRCGPPDAVALKTTLNRWQAALAEDGWNALFWSNHDLPRAVSAWGSDRRHRERSAKMLATILHLMRGTPYIYQGEEIGMTNAGFTSIDQYRDVETLARHRALATAPTGDIEDFLESARAVSRDNARTPMQWTAGRNAGFSSGTPWIDVNPNHETINVQACRNDPDSVFAHYRQLIALRKAHRVIVYGRYEPFLEDDPRVVAYVRQLDGVRLAVIANFTGEATTVRIPSPYRISGQCLVFNVTARFALPETCALQPFEAFAVIAEGGGAQDRSA